MTKRTFFALFHIFVMFLACVAMIVQYLHSKTLEKSIDDRDVIIGYYSIKYEHLSIDHEELKKAASDAIDTLESCTEELMKAKNNTSQHERQFDVPDSKSSQTL